VALQLFRPVDPDGTVSPRRSSPQRWREGWPARRPATSSALGCPAASLGHLWPDL